MSAKRLQRKMQLSPTDLVNLCVFLCATVAHSDFNKHPTNYHPIPPFVAKAAPYRYLETDNALAYPGLDRGSEAGVGNFVLHWVWLVIS